ncbi:uncharacterized protein LOC119274692 [Triticum dicoccoides]|uniref:uncharacterized protein LOC119274692 n=1 Tax=Triticum dicoccoides TaxID=85692 RepID=UPI000E7A2297|nr:uncharacterized protein LOC119274692 [Triticum dicoccoides]XP_037411311.1 uncharacterized protein LOC119274692 [Triticum dicoccoides]
MADASYRQRLRDAAKCRHCENTVISQTETIFRRPVNIQRHLNDLFRIEFPLRPTPDQFMEFYRVTHERYEAISFMSVPGVLYDGRPVQIPVTAPGYIEEQTYHTIVIRLDNGYVVEFLIQESKNYVVGLRVYRVENQRNAAPWFVFNTVTLPRYFGECIPINYPLSYTNVHLVLFGAGAVSDAVDFFSTYLDNPHQQSTDQGKLHCQLFFLLFGEGPRFRIAQQWARDNALNANRQHPEAVLLELMHDYSKLCDCSFHIYQYYVEIPFLDALLDDLKELSPFARTLSDAKKMLEPYEAKYGSAGLVFRRGDGKVILESLVGGELLLLNYNYKFCTRIQMRRAGYDGQWFERLSK